MTRSKYVGGGIVGTVMGYGLGHAIQGRYSDTGWKYTAIETGLVTRMAIGYGIGLSSKGNNPVGGILFASGLVGYLITRVFEAVDVWGTETSVTLLPAEKGTQIAISLRF